MNVKDIRRQNLRVLARSVGGITQLAERLAKSQSQISHLIGTNPIKNIGDRFAAEVEQVFTKPNGWMDHEHPVINEEGGIYRVSGRQYYSEVPLLNWQEALQWLDPKDANFAGNNKKNSYQYLTVPCVASKHAFALQVEGDSMEAPSGVSFPNQSLIIVDPEERANNGAYVLAKPNNTSPIVFKQLIIDGSRRYLKPLNPRYPLMEISAQAIICGVVKLLLMEFK